MGDDDIIKLNKHDQIIERLNESNKSLFAITSKLNGEYVKMDKEGAEYRVSFSKDLDQIKKDTTDIKTKLETVIDGYVKREEFEVRFKRLQEEIDGRFEGVNDRTDTKIDTDKFDEHTVSIKESLQSLQDNQKWVVRLILGAVIMSLLGLIFVK